RNDDGTDDGRSGCPSLVTSCVCAILKRARNVWSSVHFQSAAALPTICSRSPGGITSGAPGATPPWSGNVPDGVTPRGSSVTSCSYFGCTADGWLWLPSSKRTSTVADALSLSGFTYSLPTCTTSRRSPPVGVPSGR